MLQEIEGEEELLEITSGGKKKGAAGKDDDTVVSVRIYMYDV